MKYPGTVRGVGFSLAKAAKGFDEAFAAVPKATRDRIALAVYRLWPAACQYSRDLGVLSVDPKFRDACWDLLVAIAFRMLRKGKKFAQFSDKEIAQLRAAAPRTLAWGSVVGQAIATDGASVVPAQIEGKTK